jgi:polyisoprenoid-binding protein YceI
MNFIKVLLIIFTPFLSYGSESWKINTDHSSLNFKVKYLSVADITGQFLNYSGYIYYIIQLQLILKVYL